MKTAIATEIKTKRIEELFTETYKKHTGEHVALREAHCLKVVFPAVLKPIQETDLFAGRLPGPGEFSWDMGQLGNFCSTDELKKELAGNDLDEETRNRYLDIIEFWRTENTTYKTRQAYGEKIKSALESDDWQNDSGIAFPLYRIAGAYLDYDKLLKAGIPGMKNEIESKMKRPDSNKPLYEGMLIALEVLRDSCLMYAKQAVSMAAEEQLEGRKLELLEMATSLNHIAGHAPATFHQAIQLAWLYICLSGVINYGRFDVYTGDFYAADLSAGRITAEKALRLLQSFWKIIADRKTTFNGRIIIGGKGRRNETNANKVALLCMEATRTVHEIEPQLSLRFYNGQDSALYEKALTVIGEGRTYPMLYNDEINVPAVSNAFAVSLSEAEQYMPFGCGEYALDHCSIGSPNGVINLLKALEITLNNGTDPILNKAKGLALGTADTFTSFDELWKAYTCQVEYHVEALADQESIEYKICGQEGAFLYMTMLYDDCIDRGKALFSGGVRYLGGTLETYGNINTANSLAAIKNLVYDTKTLSLQQLVDALKANFIGFERELQLMLHVPKYGNDNAEADAMAVAVHDHICSVTRNQKNRTDLHSFLVVIINNHANTILGRATAASADGRKAGAAMANANNPAPGSDHNGVTAFLNSLVKLDPTIHAGSVQNMKFSPELFGKAMRPKLEALLKTYFVKGGTQAMISVVRRGDLEAALKAPEKYANLMVRVGGFSARFVELMKDVQLEILNRTLY